MEKSKGFTLIEILVYVAILGIIGSIVANLFLNFIGGYAKIKIKREVLASSTLALDNIIFEMKNAKSIYTPSSSASQLSLETFLNPPQGENYTYTDFYLDNGKIYVKKEGFAAEALTSDRVQVTSLNFTYLGSAQTPISVKIEINAQYLSSLVQSQNQSKIYITSSVSLRNY